MHTHYQHLLYYQCTNLICRAQIQACATISTEMLMCSYLTLSYGSSQCIYVVAASKACIAFLARADGRELRCARGAVPCRSDLFGRMRLETKLGAVFLPTKPNLQHILLPFPSTTSSSSDDDGGILRRRCGCGEPSAATVSSHHEQCCCTKPSVQVLRYI